jgi:hypothetical protein
MSLTLAQPIGDRFAYIIAWTRNLIGCRVSGRPALIPIMMLISVRLGRAAQRFERLLARYRAGTLRAPIPRAKSTHPRPPPVRWEHPGDAWRMLRMPRSHAWLLRHVQETATAKVGLEYLMAEPDFAAVLAAAPQMARIFRPICRLLGVEMMPEAFRPLPRKPRPKPAPPPELPPLRWRGYEIPKGRKKPPGYPKRRLLPFE